MRRQFLLRLCAIAGLSVAVCAPVFAGDALRGKEKSISCQACHGADGNSPVTTFPIVAGQHQDYLLRSLREYKSGARSNAIMKAIVAPLSDLDMQDLSAYYASQTGLRSIDAGWQIEIP